MQGNFDNNQNEGNQQAFSVSETFEAEGAGWSVETFWQMDAEERDFWSQECANVAEKHGFGSGYEKWCERNGYDYR